MSKKQRQVKLNKSTVSACFPPGFFFGLTASYTSIMLSSFSSAISVMSWKVSSETALLKCAILLGLNAALNGIKSLNARLVKRCSQPGNDEAHLRLNVQQSTNSHNFNNTCIRLLFKQYSKLLIFTWYGSDNNCQKFAIYSLLLALGHGNSLLDVILCVLNPSHHVVLSLFWQ